MGYYPLPEIHMKTQFVLSVLVNVNFSPVSVFQYVISAASVQSVQSLEAGILLSVINGKVNYSTLHKKYIWS